MLIKTQWDLQKIANLTEKVKFEKLKFALIKK